MVNLKDLKIGKEYYTIDEEEIIKFKVINKLKGGKIKGFVEVQFLNYLDKDNDKEIVYSYYGQKENEIITEKLYKTDEGRIFNIENLNLVKLCLIEAEKEFEESCNSYEYDNFTPEHEYPDWDGDESIMYYLDNYREENETDIIYNLEYFYLDDLLKLMNHLNLEYNDIDYELIEFLKYLGLDEEDTKKRAIANYIFYNYCDDEKTQKTIIDAINELNIELPDYNYDSY